MDSNFWVCEWHPKVRLSKWKLLSSTQYLPVLLFIMLYKLSLPSECVGEIPKCGHSNESYWAVLSRNAVFSYLLQLYTFLEMSSFPSAFWAGKDFHLSLVTSIGPVSALHSIISTRRLSQLNHQSNFSICVGPKEMNTQDFKAVAW